MQLLPLTLVVAILAGLLNYLGMRFGFLVWPAFVSWGIFFLLGSNKEAIVKAIPPMIVGLLAGYLTITAFKAMHGDAVTLSLLVFVLAFVLVFMMNIPWLAAAPAGFLACATYFGVGDPIKAGIPLLIGLFVGYISVWIPEKLKGSNDTASA